MGEKKKLNCYVLTTQIVDIRRSSDTRAKREKRALKSNIYTRLLSDSVMIKIYMFFRA